MKRLNTAIILASVAALAACGGKSKGPKGAGGTVGQVNVDGGGAAQAPKDREVSKDAQKDFDAAVAFHKEKTKDGWSNDVCSAVADKWASVAGEHGKLIEARYNAGMAYHQCEMLDQAEEQYKQVLRIVKGHAPSISNIGEIKFARGDVRGAKAQWELALKADSKLVAARNNLAYLLLEDLRETKDRSSWNKLEKEARDQLSSVLAVDQSNHKAYTLYGLVYLEGSERNKNRLDLAKLLLDEAKKHNPKYPPLHNAYGLLYMKRKSPGVALEKFMSAVELDPSFLEARMNVGNITLSFRKYDTAAEQFSYVVGKDKDNYDAHIGLGIAQRGQGKIDDAEQSYERAIKVDGKRAEAFFNLGVLYKDFRANKASDLEASIKMYDKAKSYFRKFLSKPGISSEDKKEAEENIKDCDKTITQIRNAIKAMKAVEEAEKGN